MRRFLIAAGAAMALAGAAASGAVAASNPAGQGQPSQSCQATTPPAFPGHTGSAPGSAFNGTAGSVYANPTSQGGVSSGNPKVVAQYDVACYQQTQHH